jgi:hypothetical protein
MIGISDPWILAGYALCILTTLVCVAYGALNWDRGREDERSQMAEEAKWERKEKEALE